MPLPFSQACENNKQPIADVLQHYLQGKSGELLEIGSGTGQHAVYLSKRFPQLNWQPSDLKQNISGLRARVEAEGAKNMHPVLELDVRGKWPEKVFDFIFTANTCHIMSRLSVAEMFPALSRALKPEGLLFIYGPFKYNGRFTTQSNADFDIWLKQKDPDSGVRDFEFIMQLANDYSLTIVEDHDMPANNQLLVFKRL